MMGVGSGENSMGKLWWFGMAVIFLVVFPAVAIIVLVLLGAAVMAGGAVGGR